MGPVICGGHENVFEPLCNQNRERLLFRRAPEVTLEHYKLNIRTRQRKNRQPLALVSHWVFTSNNEWVCDHWRMQFQWPLVMESHSSVVDISKQGQRSRLLVAYQGVVTRLTCRGQQRRKQGGSWWWVNSNFLRFFKLLWRHKVVSVKDLNEKTGTKAQLWLLFLLQEPRVITRHMGLKSFYTIQWGIWY